ncbi:glutamate ABC transporter substrate-binding protein [Actinomyces sp. 565]|uniref:glutamate ABC transporter substrate-binding protein n=1 Tax=Actinomyces sp. 565 TaxID=2057794 RepID=UPI0013A6DFEA|nr:glutamate ABC transporter substrate-binding protein [Actinomyces sp. 565]NDR52874.1 glutamate ABC transporter substrate-binding protein [Actinomyces sp. 565]
MAPILHTPRGRRRPRTGPGLRARALAAVIIGLAVVMTPLAACGADSAGSGHTIRIGIKFDQPGMGLKDGARYTGFDVEMGRAIAGKLGYTEDEITWIEAVSAQRETMLQNGQVDMVIGTYSITDARREKITFAGPYFIAGQDLLVRTGSDINGPDDMVGHILCSVEGSTSAQTIRDNYSSGSVQLFPVRSYSQCVEFLAAGTVDAVTTDNIILAGFAAQPNYTGKVEVVGNAFSEEHYGVGLPKDGAERCRAVNQAITQIIAEGTWSRLLEESVGTSFDPDTALNPPAVDDSLCE